MSTEKTKPVALRMTDAGRERLLRHGGSARAAVDRLLEIADEHATCPPPGRRKGRTTSTRQQPTSTFRPTSNPSTEHTVTVNGQVVFRSTSRPLAWRRAAAERATHGADAVEVQ